MKTVLELILQEMEPFLENWTDYMYEAGYLEHTTAKRDDCILSIRGIVEPMLVRLAEGDELGFTTTMGHNRHLADFIINTARRHMARGISAEMFFGCLKTLIHSVEDIIITAPSLSDAEKLEGTVSLRRTLDAIESIAINDWASLGENERLDSLAEGNRALTMDKNKYENIFQSTSDMVLVVDDRGEIFEANASAHDFFGHDIEGSSILVLLGIQDTDMTALADRLPLGTQDEYALPGGSAVFAISIVPLKKVSLASPGYVVILNDVTCMVDKRMQLENLVAERTEALSQSENLFRSLFSSAGEGIMLVDERLTIVQANPKAADMFGAAPRDFIGMNCARIFHPDSIDALRAAASMTEGDIREGEANAVTMDGDTFPAHFALNRFRLGDESFLHLIIRNVTPQKALEEHLRQEKAKADEMNVTLRNVMKTIDREKEEIEHSIAQKITTQIIPSLQKLAAEDTTEVRQMYMSIMRDQLAGLARSGSLINDRDMLRLTRSELQVCKLIQSGYSGKDIGEAMNISFETVQTHRKNIRRKLGLSGKDVNLFAYLNKQ